MKESLLDQSRTLIARSRTVVAASLELRQDAVTAVARAKALLRRGQDAADTRHEARLACVSRDRSAA